VKTNLLKYHGVRHLLVLFYLLLVSLVYAQIPPGYYDPANGKTGVALQAALHNIIKGHIQVTYGSLYSHFQVTDVRPGNVVWDMYSDIPGGTPPYVYHYTSGNECGNYNSEGDCYNREHSWPNSWFGGEVYPMYTDMFHLYPTDGYVNNRRSNYPYAKVSTATWTAMNGSKVGSCATPGYSGIVFEPIDEYKGDFARSYFYMSTRYYTEDSGWPGSDETTGSQLKPWALAMMLQWNTQDPVSQKEIDRNNAIYGIQSNRNPYIDHPDYANLIWGGQVGIDAAQHASQMISVYPNPAEASCFVTLPSGMAPQEVKLCVVAVAGNRVPIGFSVAGDQIMLDASNLSSGIYMILLSGSGKSANYYGKLVKR